MKVKVRHHANGGDSRVTRSLRAIALFTAFATVASLCDGCFAIGLGIGANTTRWEPPKDPGAVAQGTDIRLRVERENGRLVWVKGAQARNSVHCVMLVQDGQKRCVPRNDLRSVEYANGHYALTGFLIGLGVDAVTWITLIVVATQVDSVWL